MNWNNYQLLRRIQISPKLEDFLLRKEKEDPITIRFLKTSVVTLERKEERYIQTTLYSSGETESHLILSQTYDEILDSFDHSNSNK